MSGNDAAAHSTGPAKPRVSADEAMRRLIAGNERFLAGQARFTGMGREMLADLVKGQQPYATILGCSDSRVPPELIFDALLGELFVIRVAGNVLSSEVAASLQYAGAHLQTLLFVVLGHQGCGAVQAALESKIQDTRHGSRIKALVDNILPGLEDVDLHLSPELQLGRAVEANVRWSVRQIRESPEWQARSRERRMKLVGAVYEIESGRVRCLGDASDLAGIGNAAST